MCTHRVLCQPEGHPKDCTVTCTLNTVQENYPFNMMYVEEMPELGLPFVQLPSKSKYQTELSDVRLSSVRVTERPKTKQRQLVIIPCTHQPAELGEFEIQVLFRAAASVSAHWVCLKVHGCPGIRIEKAPTQRSKMIRSAWSNESAGGCQNTPAWVKNPQFSLELPESFQSGHRKFALYLRFVACVPLSVCKSVLK